MADITITAANVAHVSGTTTTGTAGATITAGMPVYKDSTDSNELKGCDADAEASAAVVGIALHAASDGQPLTYANPGSVVNMGATLTAAEIYVCSTTAGGVAPEADISTTGDFVTVLGVAQTTANLKFNPCVSATAIP